MPIIWVLGMPSRTMRKRPASVLALLNPLVRAGPSSPPSPVWPWQRVHCCWYSRCPIRMSSVVVNGFSVVS